MLEAHSTAALATSGEDGPWASSVFYASDDRLCLYFLTDGRTRHGRNLAGDGRVAAAINADVSAWSDIRGLQIEGVAAVVPETGREEALNLYLDKFGAVRTLTRAPRDDDEHEIGRRLGLIPIWKLVPARVRILDNRVRFGWKEEFVP